MPTRQSETDSKEKKHYNPAERELYWQNFWGRKKIYEFDPSSTKPLYSIDTPPPTVSGNLHLGHVFSYVQAEVIVRSRRHMGFNVRYPFGVDDNGLPTERLTEKETGHLGRNTSRADFIKLCSETAEKYAGLFHDLFQRLGFSMDFELKYSTISPEIQHFAQKSFIELFNRKLIYYKEAPALYCPECRTSVAQAEVEDKQKKSFFYDIAFKSQDGKELVIATTRPEMLPACVAVFVNSQDERYCKFIGQIIETPLGDKVPILTNREVSEEKGTGMVMCCTYGDETDLTWVREYALPEKVIINNEGRFFGVKNIPSLNGKTVEEGRVHIINYLKEKEFLKGQREIEHDVGVHERCGVPIEIIPIGQWFVKVLENKDQLREIADKVKWHPPYMKKRYLGWVEGLKWDWCISRGRYYGISVPVWHCQNCDSVVLPSEEELPVNPRTDIKERNCPRCHFAKIVGDNNVLDNWFISSQTPEINNLMPANDHLKGRLYPMSMRALAHDIIRTWVFYSMVMGVLTKNGEVPWENLMISGHIMAKKGEKISKRTGGGSYNPSELVSTHSADAVRYVMCGASLGQDVFFDEQEVDKGKRLVTKLFNAGKLVIGSLGDYSPREGGGSPRAIDLWLLSRLEETEKTMVKDFSDYEFGRARQAFESFFWTDFCDRYLEIVKGRIYGPECAEKQAAKKTLYSVYMEILKLASPFVPHITEEMYHSEMLSTRSFISGEDYGYFYKREGVDSIHKLLFEQKKPDVIKDNTRISEGAQILFGIISIVREQKVMAKKSYGSPIVCLTVEIGRSQDELIRPFLPDLLPITRAEKIEVKISEEKLPTPKVLLTF